jgi:poly(3-hydroxybutyrate) depolymerase
MTARVADDKKDWTATVAAYEVFIVHYPKSASRSFADKRLRAARKELAAIRQKEEERRLAMELANLTVSELFADLARVYRVDLGNTRSDTRFRRFRI